jgi:Peptidase family M28
LVDLRIYRACFVVALLAVVVCMFSLEGRPHPLSSTLAPDAFDDQAATATAREIVARQPDRHAGGNGDAALADDVEGRLKGLGFQTSRDEFSDDVDGETASLTNVTGVLSGSSEQQLVVLAHRDAETARGISSAATTGVFLELARALAAARHHRTLVFVSTDGGDAGGVGAQRFADHHPGSGKVEAALVLDDVAATRAERPFVIPWSDDGRRASLQLQRTTETALARELGAGTGSVGAFGQFVQQAWPVTLREQGPLLAAGMNAVTLTARGDVPVEGADDTAGGISQLRLARSGKAALAAVLALDAAPDLESAPASYLVLGHQMLPAWSIALLALGFLVPALVTALDAFARARRRAGSPGRWLRWGVAVSVPFIVVVLAARLFDLLGWLPGSAAEALAPAARPTFSEMAPALGALAVLFALAWLVARPIVAGGEEIAPREPAAAIGLSLLLSCELLLLWIGNPFAALLLVPVVHLCLLTALPAGPNRRLLLVATATSALVLPVLVLPYYGAHLDFGADLGQYLLLVLATPDSLWTALVGALVAGGLLAATMVVLRRPPREHEIEITVRGPSTYAGPGSLGGTESAFRPR